MKRSQEMTEKVVNDPQIQELKGKAIDKVTAAAIAVGLLNRLDHQGVEETEREEKTVSLLEDAVYFFRLYLRKKLGKYEELLQEENTDQNEKIKDAFDDGNKVISEHDFTRHPELS